MNKHLALSRLLLIALLVSPLTPALAKIYTWIDADGNTIYSDQAIDGATEVKLPPPQTWSATDIQSTPAVKPSRKMTEPASAYRLLSFSQPLHDQAMWESNGQVDIALTVEPALKIAQGHSLRITLDNKVIINKASNNRLQLNNIDRGSHQLQATIYDRSGNVLIRSKTITFHLHRPSIVPKTKIPAR